MTTVKMWYRPDHPYTGLTAGTAEKLSTVLDGFITDDHYLDIMQMVITDAEGVDHLMDLAAASSDGVGALRYSSHGQQWFTKGEPSGLEAVEFTYFGTPHEFPTDSLIPLAKVRQAAAEFQAADGQRPTCVAWQ
ncbi:MAG: Imm1 family immunity protein [Stackebrandtia sp.]